MEQIQKPKLLSIALTHINTRHPERPETHKNSHFGVQLTYWKTNENISQHQQQINNLWSGIQSAKNEC